MDKKEIQQIIREEIKSILESNIILDPYILASWIEENKGILIHKEVELYDGQSTVQVLNFLTNGRPSPIYIKTIIKNLVDLGFEVEEYQFKKQSELKPSSSAMVSGPTEPSKGYMGSSWTGD